MKRSELVKNWVDSQVAAKTIPFAEVLVMQNGKTLFHHFNAGETNNNVETTIYRVFSMTKPIVSMALMLLVEQGKLLLNEPVWKYLGPAWKRNNMCVVDVEATKQQGKVVTKKCTKTITLHHLLTHTSGLSHGLIPAELGHVVDTFYSENGLGGDVLLNPKDPFPSLQAFCDALAKAPLSFQPGEAWQYSWSVELVGRVVEVVSKQTLEDFLQENVFQPLDMKHTSFRLQDKTRLSAMFLPTNTRTFKQKKRQPDPLEYCSGSGGLFSTAQDYAKFCDMLVNKGTVRSTGQQIISSHTLRWMTSNHLTDPSTGQPTTVRAFGIDEISKEVPSNVGFGLGFAVTLENKYGDGYITFPGEYYWSGAASTFFFVNPVEQLSVVFITQLLMPLERDVPLNSQLHAVVYGGLQAKL